MATNPCSSNPLIVVIGSLNIDYVTVTSRCPLPGETLNATSLSILAGGKGANQAVACGKAAFTSPGIQDVEVEMIGAVGTDDVYVEKLLLPTLRESGVGTGGIKATKDFQTGTASIVVESQSGENRIMVVGGSNHGGMNDSLEVLARVDNDTRSNREPDVVVMQGEIPKKTVLELLEHFNKKFNKTKVVFNPAPVFPDGIPVEALAGLEVLVMNETEALLLGKALENEGFRMNGVETEDDLQDLGKLSKMALQFHEVADVKTVLITLGARGSYYSNADSGKQDLIPSVKVQNVVDTTAAGDTFVGYFSAALARHSANSKQTEAFDVANAVKVANEAAAKCVQKAGAMQSVPFGYE